MLVTAILCVCVFEWVTLGPRCVVWLTWHAFEGWLSSTLQSEVTCCPHHLHYDPSCVLIILQLPRRLREGGNRESDGVEDRRAATWALSKLLPGQDIHVRIFVWTYCQYAILTDHQISQLIGDPLQTLCQSASSLKHKQMTYMDTCSDLWQRYNYLPPNTVF